MSEDQFSQRRGFYRYHDHPDEDEDAVDGGEGSGGMVKPRGGEIFTSILKQETVAMENERRRLEQSGHRQYATVNAREKSDNPIHGNTASMMNGLKEHPRLQTQRYDGVDASLNPAPPDNPAALAQFENERAEQDKEKQLRLGNELTNSKGFSRTPKLTL